MAELVADLLGGALALAVQRHRERISMAASNVREWLEDVARPPDGVELKSNDGSTYSGVFLVERNELVVMLAVRHPPGAASPPPVRPSVVTSPPRDESLPFRGIPDPDDPIWDRDPHLHR